MTWIAVGIGAAVGATGGAIIGSKKGGDDVWKGALLGGLGGATLGGGAQAALGAGTAAQGLFGAGAAAEGAVPAVAGLAEGAAGSSLPLGMTSTTAGAFGSGAPVGAGIVPSAFSSTGAGLSAGTSAGVPTIASAAGAPAGATGTGIGGWWSGLGNVPKAGIIGAGTMGLGALMNKNNGDVPEQETYDGPLSQFHYNPSSYTPTYAEPNVYKPRYADGGIACLAEGGEANPMDPIQNPIYPQSQQDHTNFATSTQYPNSIKSAMGADYDARTNPMTGAELPMGMAEGGLARRIFEDVAKAQAAEQASTANEGAMNDAFIRQLFGYAEGGIASLGGYSDGGQLLKGPGSGVSDDIPATIAGKQPARLANNEFVLPARIVSEIGEGSTDAGAKKLYQMMDRIQARRGKTVGKGKFAAKSNAAKELDRM